MKYFTLPEDLLENTQQHKDPIYILDYRTSVNSIKTRITFKHNLFSFLIEGDKVINYPGFGRQIDNSQFLLLPSGNCLMTEKITSAEGNYRSILFFFDNKVLGDVFIKYPDILKSVSSVSLRNTFLVFQHDDFLNNFVNSLNLMLNSGQHRNPAMQLLKLEELILHLCTQYPTQILSLRDALLGYNEGLEISKVMEANLENNLTVEELAFLCNISISTFKRRFTKIYNTSPNKWLLTKRMEHAARLLQKGDKASDIYYRLNYENLSSFIEAFKQIYGITPKKYQTRNMNV
ncbi:helix-turn-helix domain-containing protein [Pedobacter cryoconitis]|uniref:AraC-like DNA-binding protein n=1 Tax=Pedobacter cryoconitis TaxID=188932 RepID=A0A7X0J6X8_9SPHI|nr:AraC family transcriptional regulator [Pedobacter cryoconitis]MBB6501427.1 AraC-like DNA-binding protein [Pedobacter cryoconitis]